jgi:hypothetical protein
MKKTVLYLPLILLLSIISSVILVYKVSHRPNDHKNGFKRTFFYKPPLTLLHSIDIKYNPNYIAGAKEKFIYIGYQKEPFLAALDYNLSNITFKGINTSSIKHFKDFPPYMQVDSSYIFFTSQSTPSIVAGNLLHFDSIYFEIKKKYFTAFLPISMQTFVLRQYDPNLRVNILSKINYDTPLNKLPLEKQVDGFFCTDGMLRCSPDKKRIVYLYYYRNQFLCMDSNLNVLYKANTIDTTRKAQITVSNDSLNQTLSSPAFLINKYSFLSNDKIFNESNLLADNEDRTLFNKNTIVDVYNLYSGKYIASFYIPPFHGIKGKEFIILNDEIYVLYKKNLVVYKLNIANNPTNNL